MPTVTVGQENGHRVITYDRRGFGRSSRAAGYDYDTFAADTFYNIPWTHAGQVSTALLDFLRA